MSNVDLHVAAADLAAKTKEAAGLTKLNIDKMSTQWLQVNATAHTCASDIHATTSSPIIAYNSRRPLHTKRWRGLSQRLSARRQRLNRPFEPMVGDVPATGNWDSPQALALLTAHCSGALLPG